MLFFLLTIGPAFCFACGNILEKSGISKVGKRTGGVANPWQFFKGVVSNGYWLKRPTKQLRGGLISPMYRNRASR